MKKALFVLFFVLSLNTLGLAQNLVFNQLFALVEQKNFFKTKEIYELKKKDLSARDQQLIEVFIDNAFNHPESRTRESANFFRRITIFLIRYSLHYTEQKRIIAASFSNIKKQKMLPVPLSQHSNTCLLREKRMKCRIIYKNCIKMEKDKAGLNNLKITSEKDTINFIFDTGANFSTTTLSTAKRLNMNIIPVDIEVSTITGETVQAQLAVCPMMYLGKIEIKNSIFLVLDDKGLSFPQIDYQIYGILGFPVIEALREIQIGRDGYFVVPKEETEITSQSNMAMNGLTPLIYIDGMHFTFDTGADQTILYNMYYKENKEEIEGSYKSEKVSLAGAGGAKEFDGYIISKDFHVMDKTISLTDIQLLKDKIKEDETVYGNIGQDLIKQFPKMTLNFDRMFIRFD
ncbi:MAG: retropepsin-like domain-containing protein [Bacteroidales bacterium]|nr:retropepsin-like domain-containing protein [Bacteroidales bacterium]